MPACSRRKTSPQLIPASAGRDTINGRGGDDEYVGGGGDDVFVFSGTFGNDQIRDFNAGGANDRINLAGVASITDFTDLDTNHMSQVGAHVVIDAGGGNVITLLNTDILTIDQADFIF